MAMTDEEVYRKYADELVTFATGLVGPFDAPDVVAEACLAAFGSDGWRAVVNHRAYLYRAVLNQAHSHYRTTLRRRRRERRAALPEAQPLTEPDLDVLRAVDRLSVRQRAVVMLTYWEDLACADVAARLGISTGSVKRHLARARRRLRGFLDA
jgi:RNA polymerase sigma factor (sigma-70 family)